MGGGGRRRACQPELLTTAGTQDMQVGPCMETGMGGGREGEGPRPRGIDVASCSGPYWMIA